MKIRNIIWTIAGIVLMSILVFALSTSNFGNINANGNITIFDSLNVANNVNITGMINASDWSNVSITESQIIDLSPDTNSTTECGDNEFLRGDGTCQTIGATTNFFDQDLNRTNNATFEILNASFGNFSNDVEINGRLVFDFLINQTQTLLSELTDDIDAVNRNLFNQPLNTTSDVEFHNLTIQNLSLAGNFSTPSYISCNLETDSNGDLVCGTDDTGGAGSSSWQSTSTTLYNDTASVNVGIGTSSPTQKLEVDGNVNITSNLTIGVGTIYSNGTDLVIKSS